MLVTMKIRIPKSSNELCRRLVQCGLRGITG